MWHGTLLLIRNIPSVRRGQKTDSECFPTNFHSNGKWIRLKGCRDETMQQQCDSLRHQSISTVCRVCCISYSITVKLQSFWAWILSHLILTLSPSLFPGVILLIHISLVPCLSLPYLPPLVRLAFCFQNGLGTFGPEYVCAVSPSGYSGMQRHPTSFPKLSTSIVLVSHRSSPSFCQMLPHSGSDLRTFNISSTFCSLHPTAVTWSHFPPFFPPPHFSFDLVPEFHYLIDLFQ